MKTFQELVDLLALKSGVFSEIKVKMILNNWNEIIGEPLASRTKPLALKGGVLYVLCEDGVWASELRFFIPDIVKKIKIRVGDIRSVDTIKIVRRSEEIV